MHVEPKLNLSDFAEFADTLHGSRVESEVLVRHALRRVGDRYPQEALPDLNEIARALEKTLGDLDRAAEELRVQNDALFAAKVELEGSAALFRELFELAPTPYVVTNRDTVILYANLAGCEFLGFHKNSLAGKPLISFVPLEDRDPFRMAVLRSNIGDPVSTWTAPLFRRQSSTTLICRMRVRAMPGSGPRNTRMLYWNITEETDEDLF